MEQTITITLDVEELISLRDFGYINDEGFEDKGQIEDALHSVIEDLWKMVIK